MRSILESDLDPMKFFNFLAGVGKSTAKEFKKFKRSETNVNAKYLGGSISNYAKNLTMTFPMLCDNTISPETASMISRANERYIVTMFRLLFASASFEASDGVDVIRSIHRDVKSNFGFDDYFEALDNYKANSEAVNISEAAIREATEKMIAELKRATVTFESNFEESSLANYAVLNDDGIRSIREAGKGAYDSQATIAGFKFNPGDPDLGIPPAYVPDNIDELPKGVNWDNNYKRAQFYNDLYFKTANQQLQQKRFEKEYELDPDARKAAEELDKLKKDEMKFKQGALDREYLTKQLGDNEIKKSNEMAPTLMLVRYNEYDSDHNFIKERDFIAGVKSRLIATDPYDIVDRIVSKNRTKVSFLNLIRATTGEIRFMKDFLLCVDQAKIDAKNNIKKGESAIMWKTLEALAIKNARNRMRRSGNDASAITTLVLNKETVNVLKKQYDFDLEKVKNANMVMEVYNLLGIIIVDESTEIVEFLYRGNERFEQQAFSFLEKEDRDKSYKKIINLMGQTGRF